MDKYEVFLENIKKSIEHPLSYWDERVMYYVFCVVLGDNKSLEDQQVLQ